MHLLSKRQCLNNTEVGEKEHVDSATVQRMTGPGQTM